MTATTPVQPTARLGRFASDCATMPLSQEVMDKAAYCLLDAFGLAILARGEATFLAYCDTIADLPEKPGYARIWGNGAHTLLSGALEANGIAVHGHFHDDSEYSSWSHPASFVVPAAVSLGEACGADLDLVLRGIVSGYTAMNWLGAGETVARAMIARGVRTSPALGTVGAAAAAATVLKLDSGQAAKAIGIATSITGGLLEPVRTGSDEWRLQNGRAASGGVTAALLAARGVVGAPTGLEGPKGLLAAYAGLDAPPPDWSADPDPEAIVSAIVAKPYATLGDNMAPAVAAKLLHDDGVDVDAIDGIRLTLWRPYSEYPGTDFRGPFTETAQALASTVFATAAMLTFGELEYDINRDRRDHPTVLRLAAIATIEPDDVGGPEDSTIELRMKDGTVLTRSSREAPRTLLYHDRPTATALIEARLLRMGWAPGRGTAFAEQVFGAIDSKRAVAVGGLLDPVIRRF
ncbi:MmgE/PrpD family protein [Microbaculum marinum]|uniref:MmgE/PrpD family protein n=1 Tax=Microbaculum marinum TaxID=1764581 RepID=A0AAW9RKF9_9HYPH